MNVGRKQLSDSSCSPENENKNHFNSLPVELVLEIFSYLTLSGLAKSCLVCKTWHPLAKNPIFWKIEIYRKIAFRNATWAHYLGKEVVKGEDDNEEFKSLPLEIAEEYRKVQRAFPEKNAKNLLKIVRLPKTLGGQLTLGNVEVLSKRFFSEDPMAYVWPKVSEEFGNRSIEKSRWVSIIFLPESLNKSPTEQQKMVDNLAKKSLIGYVQPDILEAGTYYLARFFSFPDCSYIYCKDEILNSKVIVGFPPELGLHAFYYEGLCRKGKKIGVAAIRKL